jgi:hypothetical protein
MVVAEDPSRAGHEALGLGHVRGAGGVNVHLKMGRTGK